MFQGRSSEVSPGSHSTKACRPDPLGRPIAASSPTVPTAAESSTSGSSKSAAATPSRSPNGRARTYNRPGLSRSANISPIVLRGDGGIYVIPALGGEGLERKIAPFGYFPQWSPDGSQVLFRTHFTAIGYSDRFYVARLDGSPPREVLGEWISQKQFWRLQRLGIRMERGSPSGSDPPRQLPPFGPYRLTGAPDSNWIFLPRSRKNSQRLPGN